MEFSVGGGLLLFTREEFCILLQGVEPLASTEVAMLCSNKSDTHSSQHCMAEDIWNYSSSSSSSGEGVDRSRTCPIVAGNSAEQEQQQQQQESLCSGWICDRWDGDATTAELTAQQHGRLFHFSVTFLVGEAVQGQV